jgi:hypothetical protein
MSRSTMNRSTNGTLASKAANCGIIPPFPAPAEFEDGSIPLRLMPSSMIRRSAGMRLGKLTYTLRKVL